MKIKLNPLQKIIIAILFVVVVILAGYAAYTSMNKSAISNPPQTPTNNQVSTEVNTSTDDIANIHVFRPKKGDSIGLPLKVLGEVRTFENGYVIRIKDKNGNILVEESGTALNGDAGQYNLFEKEINYPKPKTSEGTIEVLDYSAKDGSEIDKVVIPIKFEAVYNALNVEVFFGNNIKDPETKDCTKTYPAYRRIAYTKETARVALEELLKGPNSEEQKQGFFTSINTGVKINSLVVKNGVAKVDFSDTLQANVGGSCRVTAITSQITETLKQFGTVKSVIISINGQTQDILQP